MKEDDKTHLPDRTSTIDNWRAKSLKETTIQFHRDRAPGNQETGRNLTTPQELFSPYVIKNIDTDELRPKKS